MYISYVVAALYVICAYCIVFSVHTQYKQQPPHNYCTQKSNFIMLEGKTPPEDDLLRLKHVILTFVYCYHYNYYNRI